VTLPHPAALMTGCVMPEATLLSLGSGMCPEYPLDNTVFSYATGRRKRHKGCPGAAGLCLIDLGLPRHIDPHVQDVHNVFLYNLDDLQSACPAGTCLQCRRTRLKLVFRAVNVLKAF
jgi:hypothetical protein